MLCLVRYLFVINTSVIDCLGIKIRPRNDLLCIEWDVKPCSTQLNSTVGLGTLSVFFEVAGGHRRSQDFVCGSLY